MDRYIECTQEKAAADLEHEIVSYVRTEETDDAKIRAGAKFDSFKEFEAALEQWKVENFHPFRVASSETLRMPDGSTNELFKYRYIVYHCAHYGTPRMRGIGKRPNQNYLPCGCRAMLRLNYSWTENALRITTLNCVHTGHDLSEESYSRFACKTKRQASSVNGSPSPSSYAKENKMAAAYLASRTSPQPQSTAAMNNVLQQFASGKQTTPTSFAAAATDLPKLSAFPTKFGFYPPTPASNFFPPMSVGAFLEMFVSQRQTIQQQIANYAKLNNNNNNGKSVDGGLSGGRDERLTKVHPVLQSLTDQLLGAQGKEFDERVDDLRGVLTKWRNNNGEMLMTGVNQLVGHQNQKLAYNALGAVQPTSDLN